MSGLGGIAPSPLFGELGRDGNGEDPPGKGEFVAGERVNKNSRGSSCQNERWLTNILDQPSPFRSLVDDPALESSVLIKPIRSSFGRRCLPLKMPSRLILTRHWPFGLPFCGIIGFTPIVRWGFGAGLSRESAWWKETVSHFPYLMEIPPQRRP